MDLNQISENVRKALDDLIDVFPVNDKKILVVGTSTSEVIGKHIGSSGSEEIAEAIYKPLKALNESYGVHLAFQGCEHINRALTVERETAEKFALEEVSVVPHRKAGGAMSTYAFHHMKDPVVVEFIKADCGIDIGDTFIGMHLKHVAVPVRSSMKKIGEANITLAKTRPKLIGGERALYTINGVSSDTLIREIKDNREGESC